MDGQMLNILDLQPETLELEINDDEKHFYNNYLNGINT